MIKLNQSHSNLVKTDSDDIINPILWQLYGPLFGAAIPLVLKE